MTVQNSRDAEFFMANLRQIPSILYGNDSAGFAAKEAVNQTHDAFGCAAHIRDRRGWQVFNSDTSAKFGEAMDDQLRTVQRIGERLGIKPASAEIVNTGPPPAETLGAKTWQ